MTTHRFHGCGRGLLGLDNWDALRKPGEPFTPSISFHGKKVTDTQSWSQSNKSKNSVMSRRVADYTRSQIGTDWEKDDSRLGKPRPSKHVENNKPEHAEHGGKDSWGDSWQPSGTGIQKTLVLVASTENKLEQALTGGPKPGNRLLAKYSYKANANSPLGEELPLAQGDKLMFIGFHDCHWWLAQNEQGQQGFVPAQYMMVLEDKPSSLPWLQNITPEEQPVPATKSKFGVPSGVPSGAVWKPYHSAYQHKELEKKYYCDVCEKNFNGPQPYSAHMNSRGHREEVENKELYGS